MSIYSDNPCHGCEKPVRHPGCHATCERRAEWRRRFDEEMMKIRKDKEAHDAIQEVLKRRGKGGR